MPDSLPALADPQVDVFLHGLQDAVFGFLQGLFPVVGDFNKPCLLIGPVKLRHYGLVEPLGAELRDAALFCGYSLTAQDLLASKVIDEIIPEPLGGANMNPEQAAKNLAEAVTRTLEELSAKPAGKIVEERYRRLKKLGGFVAPKAV